MPEKARLAMEREGRRMRALRELEILDTPAEPEYDDVVYIASRLFSAPIALVSLMDSDRQWFKARYGLDLPETQRSIAFCDHVVRTGEPLVVTDATQEGRFRDNPLVTGDEHIRAYAGVPLRSVEGDVLGTLCFLDRVPRDIDEQQVGALEVLARVLERQFALRASQLALQAQFAQFRQRLVVLQEEQQRSREFAGDLVHDMRNPVASVLFVLEGLMLRRGDEAERKVIGGAVTAMRGLSSLIDDLLIVAQLREGRYALRFQAFDLMELLQESIATHGALASTPIAIQGLSRGVACEVVSDRRMVSRIVGNLVANAVRYANECGPIVVRCEFGTDRLRVMVVDQGPGIPEGEREAVFDRYMQVKLQVKSNDGLGFGLAFSRMAARSMGGDLTIVPTDVGTCFALDLPVHGAGVGPAVA